MRAASFAALAPAALAAATLAPLPVAQAADYLRGSQIEQPVEPPIFGSGRFDWSGFYFGGFAGQSQSRFETDRGVADLVRFSFQGTTIASAFDPEQVSAARPRRDSGVVFGGFAGYNFLFGDAVLGLEADYTRTDQEAKASTLEARRIGNEFFQIGTQQDAKLSDQFSLRARFGYSYGRLMPFFTLGAAFGRFDTNVSATSDWGPVTAEGARAGSYVGWPRTVGGPKKDVWAFGGVIGGGIEAAVTDNLILRAEYLFTRFNDVEGLTVSQNTARVGAALKF